MAKGNLIVVSENPRGRFAEGTITGTPKPGTVVMIDTATALDANGRATFVPYAPGQDGIKQGAMCVLREDYGQGKLASEAYVTGDHCYVYYPLPGDELNMLLLDISGTADDHAMGELLMVNNGDGKLVASTGSPEQEPFQLLEAVTDPAADTLAHCQFTGV